MDFVSPLFLLPVPPANFPRLARSDGRRQRGILGSVGGAMVIPIDPEMGSNRKRRAGASLQIPSERQIIKLQYTTSVESIIWRW
jgi:hypothetical protein